MLNLAFALLPSLRPAPGQERRGLLGLLARRVQERRRYRQALRELNRLDGRDLGELGLGPADFPELAERHVSGLAPLPPSKIWSLRRL